MCRKLLFSSFKSEGKCEKVRQGTDHLDELKFGGFEGFKVLSCRCLCWQQIIKVTFEGMGSRLCCKSLVMTKQRVCLSSSWKIILFRLKEIVLRLEYFQGILKNFKGTRIWKSFSRKVVYTFINNLINDPLNITHFTENFHSNSINDRLFALNFPSSNWKR